MFFKHGPNLSDYAGGVKYVIAELPAIIALANAALPDTSPYKITRKHVDAITSAAKEIGDIHGRYHIAESPLTGGSYCECVEEEYRLEKLANALAALLPPEQP